MDVHLAQSDAVAYLSADVEALKRDGIAVRERAFTPRWATEMAEDLDELFVEAVSASGGAVPRGLARYYIEIHPERLRGFSALVSHRWVVAVAEYVLGPQFRFVELGFDIALPGAQAQPWHRDFPSTVDTCVRRQLNVLAFNATAVDVIATRAPLEVAVGTHWEAGPDFDHGRVPPSSAAHRYQAVKRTYCPRRGDITVRSPLAVHRGTANSTNTPRPMLVLGAENSQGGQRRYHDMQVTERYWQALPVNVRERLGCRVVDELEPICQQTLLHSLLSDASGSAPRSSADG